MIGYLKGIIKYVDNSSIIIDVNGVGYNVYIPTNVLYTIHEYEEINVYTHLDVKEDSMKLFGFLSREELKIFKMLIEVSGLGPKGAMNIMSTYTSKILISLIINKDSDAISKVPKIGKKTSEKIIIELRDKLKKEYDNYEDTSFEIKDENKERINEILKITRSQGFSDSNTRFVIDSLVSQGIISIKDDDLETILNHIFEKI